jgi:hypothetical protein
MSPSLSVLLSLFILSFAMPASADCKAINKAGIKIEFTDETLSLTKSGAGAATEISMKEFAANECKKLEIIKGTQTVGVTFTNREAGTSVMVFETLFGVLDVTSGKWKVEPFPFERSMTGGKEHEVRKVVEFAIKQKNAKTVLVKKDLETKKTEEIPL